MSDQSKGGLEAVAISLMTLSTAAVGLRFYTRRAQRLPLKTDDAFALLALVAFLGAGACTLRMISIGVLGISANGLTEDEVLAIQKPFIEWDLSFETLMNITVTSTKLSAVFFYRRLFCTPGTAKTMSRLTIATAVVLGLWFVTFTTFIYLECGTHFSAYWSGFAAQAEYCTVVSSLYLSLALSNTILEIWVLVLPMHKVATLRTSRSKRFSVMGVFLLGFAGIGASIARTVITGEMFAGTPDYAINQDLGLADTVYFYLTTLEAGIALVAVNLPSLWYLFTDILPMDMLRSIITLGSLRGSRSRSNHSKQSGGSNRSNRSNRSRPQVLASQASDEVRVKTSVELASLHSDSNDKFPEPEPEHLYTKDAYYSATRIESGQRE